jgi:hypothetical protein
MAMTTKTRISAAALKRRMKRFYELLNRREFQSCYELIDPRVRAKASSVTLLQYQNSLARFLERMGSVEVTDTRFELHLDEPSTLYEGRDFAIGKTSWRDAGGVEREFAERWVHEGGKWYTRSTGFLLPTDAQ